MIEINGIKYTEKQKEPVKTSKALTGLMLMAAVFGGLPHIKEVGKVNVDIVEEFELIQNKKSNLSANQRRWVVHKFNQHYEAIKLKTNS